ncbi:MAG: DNA internalization-related competence protein ComEC/Rec2 [Polyangiaceae bacterium]
MRKPTEPPVDMVLLGASALVAGGLISVAPLEVTTSAAAVLALAPLDRQRRILATLVVAAAMSVGAVRARASTARHEAERSATDAAVPRAARCSARATVDASPVSVRGTLRWEARLEGTVCEGETLAWAGRAALYGGPEDLARGDEAEIVATLASPQRLWNASGGDPRPSEAHRNVTLTGGTLDVRTIRRATGLFAWVDRTRASIRMRIDATFSPEFSPMARALVLGESDLAPGDDRSFRVSGLSHLLAVSGMHLVLVLAVAVSALEAMMARVEALAARLDVGRVAAAAGIPVAWVYAELAGAGGSTLRAAWMATAALLARAMGRRTDGPRAFGLSLAAMALLDPLVVFDLSFLLSAGATAGLLAFAGPLGDRMASHVPQKGAPVARAVATTLAASIPCAPILARFTPSFPLGGVLANLVAVPLGECAALPLCLVHALLAWWPAAERGCAIAASGALVMVRAVARGFSVPALTSSVPQPTSWQLAVLTAMVAAVGVRAAKRRSVFAGGAAALLLLELGARRSGAPRGLLRATFLDVGQGDSAIVDLPDGEAMMVDGGGLVGSPIDVGVRVVAPELRARRRRALSAVVLTHPHPDHFGGLATGLDDTAIGALWDTGEGEREGVGGGYATLLGGAHARGIPVFGPEQLCGEHALGGARVEVLAPCPSFSADRGPNDNSFVIRFTFGERALLLVGDSEREEEGILLSTAPDRLHADVLKVGHHGSRTSSSPAFLAAVAPRYAVVSVGRRNRFGHPHPLTLAALAAAGARVWRTDRDGAVVVTTDGTSLDIQSIASHAADWLAGGF